MNNYLNLLISFQSLPRIRRSSTFMEISGYPHYENVCSNILGFYFNPKGEHGLGNLLLTAFFKMIEEQDGEQLEELAITKPVIVTREYNTPDNKRIDLVINSDDFILAIENKIHHWEANDFESYSRAIEGIALQKKVFKAVLCLRTKSNETSLNGGFIRYTYTTLWKHVRNLIGHYLTAGSSKWTIHLNEFMETTARLTGETRDEKEVTDFFVKNHELIQQLINDRNHLLNQVSSRIRSLESSINDLPELGRHLKNRGIYQTYTLASHFKVLGSIIGLDLNGDLTGWKLGLFPLNTRSNDVMHQLSKAPSMKARFPDIQCNKDYNILQTWDLHASELELQEALVTAFTALINAADFISNYNNEQTASLDNCLDSVSVI